ncbi:MAG: methyltransferase domain-containing protein [Thermoanaerobaculia bacterium]
MVRRHWRQSIELRWLVQAGLWIAALLALSRVPWVETRLLVPLARAEGGLAARLFGADIGSVQVGASCTGADAAALALAAILAFPARWRHRLLGVAAALTVISMLNALRLGTLAAVVERRELFQLLHVYVWPAILVVAAAGWVAVWMGAVTRKLRPRAWLASRPLWAGVALVAAVAAHYALFPLLAGSADVASACRLVAGSGGGLIGLAGGSAAVNGALLSIGGRHWLVTPECILTPILPVYLVAVGFLIRRPRWRLLAWLAAVPLFFLLAILRVLVLGAPVALTGKPEVAIHAFFQVLTGFAVVGLAWHLRGSRRLAGLGTALLTGLAAVWISGWALRLVPGWPPAGHWGHGHVDPQGAMQLLAPFQLGLFVALALVLRVAGSSAWLAGGGMLIASHLLLRLGYGELVEHVELALPVIAVRGLAVLGPVAAAAIAATLSRPRDDDRREAGTTRYRRFWSRVGDSFPDLSGASTTRQYREDEELLLRSAFPRLAGQRLLKTDLWDEARNTRIFCWAAAQGAHTFGIDISLPTILKAREEYRQQRLRLAAVAADVRSLPFRGGAFDGVYSMGTIEHFDGTEAAAAEIARVIRNGGRAIIGVPNRHDPFLRPLAVAILYRLGLYAYGVEKSYSWRGLQDMCRRAGLRVVGRGGVLFLPGLLRMADLALWTGARPLARMTAIAAAPFAWACRRFPRLRRHGYLIALTGEPDR